MTAAGAGLVGRDDEKARLGALLGHARNGSGGALLVLGDPGIGKTALLDDAAAAAVTAGSQVVRLDGYESESTLPFAAVHRLVSSLREHLGHLPPRQRQAIEVATGQGEGPPPDRFLVGLGLLGLLGRAGDASPVVGVVDDAHWLDTDSVDALAFVGRRLAQERVALVVAARHETVAERMGGIERLPLDGLDTRASLHLLGRALDTQVDPSAAAAVARATGGNPLALIDLAADLTGPQLGELAVGDGNVPVGSHLQRHYAQRLAQHDAVVRTWVLLAAADTSGNLQLITAAAKELGLGADGVDRVEIPGLVTLSPVVRFRHSLARAACYDAASGVDRRRAHRALAAAADHLGDVELEAWHASRAAAGPDPAVAARLAHAAELAARRGASASRARILARAADLTPPGPERDARRISAAEAALTVGAVHVARRLVESVPAETADPVTRGRGTVVRYQLTLFLADGENLRGTVATLVAAADDFHGREPDLERRTLMQAFEAAVTVARSMTGTTLGALGRRLDAAADAGGRDATVLRGLAAVVLLPYADAVAPARAAFDALCDRPDGELMHLGTAVAALGAFLWEDTTRARALDRAYAAARDAGALRVIDTLAWVASAAELLGGSVDRAVGFTEKVLAVRRAMGYDSENVVNAPVMAWQGAPRALVGAVTDGAAATGFGGVEDLGAWALGVRDLADGAYQDAFDRLAPLVDDPFLQLTPLQYPDYVEAAARSGHLDAARRVTALLQERAAANGAPWCRGVTERCLALLAPDDAAGAHFEAAIEALSRTVAATDLARTHLLHGEWLRRTRRRRDAADELRLAVRLLQGCGAGIFVPRGQAELAATGAGAAGAAGPVGAEAPIAPLTPQERTVARLAAAGSTNAEIAAQLFLSPSTVDYHLRKVFQRLGISSRRQLAEHLEPREP
ncbi:helix-turn-helix transcriptional regulator [Xylanimonas protaetiae]|uniref:Helix-turn-helix transcriptional regulator n=1 Tax=Xylanimonas protaetiae TaxID=2509457 RepID=A0A4P6F9L6_9MICO|nr:LuxR family transcriptional regulator [Xylanimonas protaetiae]QAY70969.1 helix-turn-helix transcriptional regulator [Xylanimonas protaetiae]